MCLKGEKCEKKIYSQALEFNINKPCRNFCDLTFKFFIKWGVFEIILVKVFQNKKFFSKSLIIKLAQMTKRLHFCSLNGKAFFCSRNLSIIYRLPLWKGFILKDFVGFRALTTVSNGDRSRKRRTYFFGRKWLWKVRLLRSAGITECNFLRFIRPHLPVRFERHFC